MTNFELSRNQLKTIAKEVGIQVIGATDAEPFDDLMPFLQRYYEEGRASGFEYPVAAERIDAKTLLSGAQSLISIAVSYITQETRTVMRPKEPRGMVSVYSWGNDYHRILRDKLQHLAKKIEEKVKRPIQSVCAIDTSALVDRAVAARSGVGFIGKNCSLITDEYGSWVFLGTLVTDVLIEKMHEDVTRWDDCADCTLCLTACPTGALIKPFEIDATRCLSYVTQMKGIIPEEFRAPLGRRVWGCDTCQTVCPKNKGSLLAQEPDFSPDAELCFPDLYHILSLSNRAFMRQFGHTSAAWRGANVWRRNALIALGNMRDRRAMPFAISLLDDARPEIRASAAWVILQIDPDKGREAVRQAYEKEPDDAVRRDMQWACDESSALRFRE